MFKLIRDNIPTLIETDGGRINYAAVQEDEFFKSLLRGKLIEEVNEYLSSEDSLEELVDIKTVIDYLVGDRIEEFKELFEQKFKDRGGYEKRFIGFFPDRPREIAANANMESTAENKGE